MSIPKPFALAVAASLILAGPAQTQDQPPGRRELTIVAENGRFSPSRMEVLHNDLVKITVRSVDHAHSFAIDAYRIVKRVPKGQSISVEFRADKTGAFPYYCNMGDEDGRRQMLGTFIVHPR